MAVNSLGGNLPQRVFVDTNVVIEAFRTNCWTAICAQFAIETVEKCVEESLTGNTSHPARISIDPHMLSNGLAARHVVDKLTLATFVLENPACAGIDDGELHLLAWLKQRNPHMTDKLLISTADKAAIRAIAHLKWLDDVICLEDLAKQAGVAEKQIKQLAQHHRKTWLNAVKTSILLDNNQ